MDIAFRRLFTRVDDSGMWPKEAFIMFYSVPHTCKTDRVEGRSPEFQVISQQYRRRLDVDLILVKLTFKWTSRWIKVKYNKQWQK